MALVRDRRLGAAVLMMLLPACSTPAQPPEPPEPSATLAPDVTPASAAPLARCDTPSAYLGDFMTGVRGDASDGSVVALIFNPLRSGSEIKIVFRVTGGGEARFTTTGPDGATVAPAWTEEHTGSTFRYPGDEWGTGFTFPMPGCWIVHVERDHMTGTLELPITD